MGHARLINFFLPHIEIGGLLLQEPGVALLPDLSQMSFDVMHLVVHLNDGFSCAEKAAIAGSVSSSSAKDHQRKVHLLSK